MKKCLKNLFTSKEQKRINQLKKELDLNARLELEIFCDYLLLVAAKEFQP